MRFYVAVTEDKKLELTVYPTDKDDEVGTALRLSKLEARNLADVVEDGLDILEEQDGE